MVAFLWGVKKEEQVNLRLRVKIKKTNDSDGLDIFLSYAKKPFEKISNELSAGPLF